MLSRSVSSDLFITDPHLLRPWESVSVYRFLRPVTKRTRTHIVTGSTPTVPALFNAILLSVVTAGAAGPSESLGESDQSEKQVDGLERERPHGS